MKISHQITASLACLAAGMLCGWLAGHADEGSAGVGKGIAAAGTEHRQHAAGKGEPALRRDFASYLRRVELKGVHEEPDQAVARMSREELQAMLAGLAQPDYGNGPSSKEDHLMADVRAAAATELLRRDGAAAIDWAQAGDHRGAWALLLVAQARVDPVAASLGYTAYEAGGSRMGLPLGFIAMKAAAGRSAADVIACLGQWENEDFRYVPRYAPDFDYGAVVKAVEVIKPGRGFGDRVKDLVGAWAAADPEAAGAAMVRGMKDPTHDWSGTFGGALDARAALIGEDAAGKWIAGLLGQVEGSRRDEAAESVADHEISTARAAALMAHLDERDGIALTVRLEKYPYVQTGQRPTLRLLQAMPTEERRISALQAIAERTVRGSHPALRAGALKDLESLMDQLQLPEAAMQKVFGSAAGE